jgi:hypothetical protein
MGRAERIVSRRNPHDLSPASLGFPFNSVISVQLTFGFLLVCKIVKVGKIEGFFSVISVSLW